MNTLRFGSRIRARRPNCACVALLLLLVAPGAASAADQRFDADVARRYAGVARWLGLWEISETRSISVSNGKGYRTNVYEAIAHGEFELWRETEERTRTVPGGSGTVTWEPSRGIFGWRGSGTAHGLRNETWSKWEPYGERMIGEDWRQSDGGEEPMRNVEFEINLGLHSASLHPGEGPTGRILQKREGHGVSAASGGDGKFHYAERVIDETNPGAIRTFFTPHDEAGKLKRWSVVQGGPGVLVFTGERRGHDVTGGDSVDRSQVVLAPIYDDVECEVTIEGYADWLPRGSIADPKKPGNALIARAVLKAKDGKTRELPEVERFRFELLDTSREPGICLNWPLQAKDSDFDLRLADFKSSASADQLGALKTFYSEWGMSSSGDYDLASLPTRGMPQWSFPEVSEGGQKGELPDPPKDKSGQPFAEAAIECFDFGAKSELRVICVLKDGREIIGLMKGEGGGQELVRLPKRSGPDWVAEKWRKENDAINLAANDDEEKVAGQSMNGDGFTLYEEYRGWVENGKHITGDPKKKDFFVLNQIGADAKGGIALFERVSKLLVHSKLRKTEIVVLPMTEIESDSKAKGERVMNLNHRDAPHRVNQHAVHMINTSGFRSGGGGTEGVRNNDKQSYAFRPGKVQLVHVEEAGTYDGIFSTDRSTALYNLSARDALFAYDRGVAHELLHAVGVDHHGEGEERSAFYFQSASDPNNPTHHARFTLKLPRIDDTDLENKWLGGIPVTAQVLARPTTITLIWEDTGRDVAESLAAEFEQTLAAARARLAANPPADDVGSRATRFPNLGKDAHYWRETEIFDYAVNNHEQFKVYATIGRMGQADSGNELCLMRYYFANAYPVPGRENAYYLVRPGDNRAGRELCKSPEGTGQNASDHKPKSRFGDSAPQRGACFQYICPNDAIPARRL